MLADKAHLILLMRPRNSLLSTNTSRSEQVAQQIKPTTVNDTVQAILEMESYSKQVPSGISQVLEEVDGDVGAVASMV